MARRYEFSAGSGLDCGPELADRETDLIRICQVLFDHASVFETLSQGPSSVLAAEAIGRNEGEAAACVADIKFRRKGSPDSEPVASFIVRFNRTEDEARLERLLATRIAHFESVFLSSTTVCDAEVAAIAPEAVAYIHAETQAGSEMAPLSRVLPEILSDSAKTDVLISQLRGVLKAVGPDGEDRMVRNAHEYVEGIRTRLMPDFILDLRGHEIVELDASWVVLRDGTSQPHAGVVSKLKTADLANPSYSLDWANLTLSLLVSPGHGRPPYFTMASPHCDGVIWLFPPSGLRVESDVTRRYSIIITEDDLRKSTSTLATLGLPAYLSTARILEDIPAADVEMRFQHADLHVSNIVAGDVAALAIDVPSFRYDAAHAARARLEASIVGLAELADPSEAIMHDSRTRLLNSVWEGEDPDSPEAVFSRRLHATIWLRRVLAEHASEAVGDDLGSALAGNPSIVALLNHIEALGTPSPEPVGTAPAPTLPTDTLRELWRAALWDPHLKGLSSRGEEIIDGLACERAAYALEATLTDLQSHLRSAALTESVFSSSRHVVVAGPTSSGKSTIGDIFLVRPTLFNRNRRSSLYIAPTRALAQARYRELTERFPSLTIILSTGDDNKDDRRLALGRFDIACMTYEKSNVLSARSRPLLDRIACIVVDEIHMVCDEMRGPVLELLLAKALGGATAKEEGLRIVALTTEQASHEELVGWLTLDVAGSTPEPPHVIHSTQRPVASRHHLAIPVRSEQDPRETRLEIVPITGLSSSTEGHLSADELKAIDKRLHSLHSRRSGDAHAMQTCVVDLALNRVEDHPRGHVVMIFVPSIGRMRQLAGEISNRLALAKPDTAYMKRLDVAIEESRTSPPEGYRKWARAGVLMHYSTLDISLRAFAEVEAATCRGESRSLIILSTTTLAYGVNLAVNDVVLMGTRFTKADRKTHLDQSDLLEQAEYFNMVGRAGRLGTGTSVANAYIIPRDGDDPYTAVVVPYYCEDGDLKSQLFHDYDYAAATPARPQVDPRMAELASLLAEEDLAGETGELRATDFTYPFARCVLDALRHANTRDRLTLGPNPVRDVLRIMTRTLYQRQVPNEDTRNAFRHAVEAILDDCATETLALVSAEQSQTPHLYKIRPLGEALIDTGTEIATVAPVLGMLSELRQAWDASCPGIPLPSELYLLALIPQDEVLRMVITRSSEFDTRIHWAPKAAESNRRAVLEAACAGMTRVCGGVSPETAQEVVEEVRSRMDKSDLLRGKDGGYTGAATDVSLRIFAGVAEWMAGGSLDDALATMNRVSDLTGIRNGQLLSIERLVDQLHYKLKFLASMLAASGRGADLERSLYVLAERVRYGCDVDGALLFAASRSRIKREQVLDLLGQGITPSQLLVGATIEGESCELANGLRDDLRRYAVDELENLADVFAPEGDEASSDGRKRVAWSFWRYLREDYQNWAKDGSCAGKARSAVRESLVEQGKSARTLNTSREDGYRVQASIAGSRSAPAFMLHGERWVEAEEHWQADVTIHFDMLDMTTSALETPMLSSNHDHIVIVAVPWVIPTSSASASIAGAIERRDQEGKTTTFMTPAGLAVMLSVLTRDFVAAEPMLELLADRRGGAGKAIGTAELMDLIDTETVPNFPAALREALATFFEPRA